MQLCCGVERSVYVCCCISIGAFCARLTPAVCRVRAKQDGLRDVAFLFRRVEIAIRAFSRRWRGYLPLWVHFGLAVCLRRSRRGDRGRGVRGWRRGACALLRGRIGSEMLSAGSTLGLRAPDCAKESSTLWTLFTLRRGCVGANTHPCKKRKCPNQRTHARKTRVHGKTRPALIYGRPGRAVQR